MHAAKVILFTTLGRSNPVQKVMKWIRNLDVHGAKVVLFTTLGRSNPVQKGLKWVRNLNVCVLIA